MCCILQPSIIYSSLVCQFPTTQSKLLDIPPLNDCLQNLSRYNYLNDIYKKKTNLSKYNYINLLT